MMEKSDSSYPRGAFSFHACSFVRLLLPYLFGNSTDAVLDQWYSVTLTCCWQRFHLKGQSNVTLATYFHKYDWLQKPSLPFFNQSWRGCSHFSRAWQRLRVLVRILIGLFRPDFVIGQSLLAKLTGLTTHLYLYRLHCWSRLGSYNRQHVYWLYGGTGQKTKSTQSTIFPCI